MTDWQDISTAPKDGTAIPKEVWPLAFYLAEEMNARGWKAEDVASRMMTGNGFGFDLLVFNMVLCVHRDKLTIDDNTFAGMARAFSVSELYLRNLDNTWRSNPSSRVKWDCPDELFGPASRRAFIRQVYPPLPDPPKERQT